jgi:hypothetical protein
VTLSAGHRRELIKLSETVFNLTDLRTAVFTASPQPVKFEAIVSLPAPEPTQWIEVLGYADTRGWLSELVTALIERRSDDPAIKAVLQDIVQALSHEDTPAWARAPMHPAYDLVIGNEAFIDRNPLRQAIEELCSDEGYRVIHVVSDDSLGKTHSHFLVDHVSERQGSFKIVITDLLNWSADDVTPLDVMTHIAHQMSLGRPEVDLKGLPDAQARILANWLVGRLQGVAQQWWLVFDGVRQVDSGRGVRDLAHYLALTAARQRNLGLRVVLLDCDDKLPKTLRAVRDQLSVPIDRLHVRQWFLQAGIDAGKVDDLVNEVFANLPATPSEYYYDLPVAVFRVAKRELG